MPFQNNMSTQLLFVMESIEFLLIKIQELYKMKVQQEGSTRKKSIIKIYDKNIDRLPHYKIEQIQISPRSKIEDLLNQLHRHKMVINSQSLIEKQKEKDDTFLNKNLQQSIVIQLQKMDGRMVVVEDEVRCLANDVGQLIFLYKQSL